MSDLTPEAAEFIPTPAWPVRRFLARVELPGGAWLEPTVGRGDLVQAVNTHRGDVVWTANDIRQVPPLDCYAEHWHRDAKLPWPEGRRWRVGMTNPPFSSALEILRELVRSCDTVALFLPAAWPSCSARFDFMREHKCDVLVLPDRVWDFVRDMAWFLWPSRGIGYEILPQTPLEERRRDAALVEAGRYRGPEQLTLLGEAAQ